MASSQVQHLPERVVIQPKSLGALLWGNNKRSNTASYLVLLLLFAPFVWGDIHTGSSGLLSLLGITGLFIVAAASLYYYRKNRRHLELNREGILYKEGYLLPTLYPWQEIEGFSITEHTFLGSTLNFNLRPGFSRSQPGGFWSRRSNSAPVFSGFDDQIHLQFFDITTTEALDLFTTWHRAYNQGNSTVAKSRSAWNNFSYDFNPETTAYRLKSPVKILILLLVGIVLLVSMVTQMSVSTLLFFVSDTLPPETTWQWKTFLTVNHEGCSHQFSYNQPVLPVEGHPNEVYIHLKERVKVNNRMMAGASTHTYRYNCQSHSIESIFVNLDGPVAQLPPWYVDLQAALGRYFLTFNYRPPIWRDSSPQYLDALHQIGCETPG